MTTDSIDSMISTMTDEISAILQAGGAADPAIIGIHTGGVWVASRIVEHLGGNIPVGSLDISFYRDDFTRIGMNPQVKPSELPFDIEDRHIILVDDVLYTGRTIRAAMNELFDYGRPASILLAVLVERGGRELPIEARVVGQHLDLADDEQVKLTGPDPLQLVVQKSA